MITYEDSLSLQVSAWTIIITCGCDVYCWLLEMELFIFLDQQKMGLQLKTIQIFVTVIITKTLNQNNGKKLKISHNIRYRNSSVLLQCVVIPLRDWFACVLYSSRVLT